MLSQCIVAPTRERCSNAWVIQDGSGTRGNKEKFEVKLRMQRPLCDRALTSLAVDVADPVSMRCHESRNDARCGRFDTMYGGVSYIGPAPWRNGCTVFPGYRWFCRQTNLPRRSETRALRCAFLST